MSDKSLDNFLQWISDFAERRAEEGAMAAILRDVAEAAGVSVSTVSRALALPHMVKPETRERVRRAAQQLGYSPNKAARGLITGRTGNIGIILPDLTNPFFPFMVKGAQAWAHDHDYAVFIADTDEDPSAELGLVRALDKQVDGLILCSPRMSEADLKTVLAESCVVLVNRKFANAPAVTFDNAGGIRQAVAHLEALGHRRIAWLAGPRDSWSNRERTRAVRSGTAAADLELAAIGHFPPSFEGGVAAADQVLSSGATAVIAYNDLMALGVMSRLTVRGLRVPDDLSVVGIDDIPMSGMSNPALTTVGLPKEQAGRAAVELLMTLIDQPADPTLPRRELAAQLIVRGSSGVAAAPAPVRR
jgi:DNA-binding LacI/PurR family transcriptional regulator